MASSNPSRASTVAVFSASVLAAATVSGYVAYFNGDTYQAGTQEVTTASGATVTAGGGTFQATNLGDAACLKSKNGNYYDCVQEDTFTAGTGGSVLTTYHNVAHVVKPYTGSGIIRRIEVSCDSIGQTANISVDQLSSVYLSGTTFINHRGVSSGALIVSTVTGSTTWRNDRPNIKVSASRSLGNVAQCLLRVKSSGHYNP